MHSGGYGSYLIGTRRRTVIDREVGRHSYFLGKVQRSLKTDKCKPMINKTGKHSLSALTPHPIKSPAILHARVRRVRKDRARRAQQ